MRDYAKVAPQFWTGKTGRHLREAGHDVQLVALYLLTCPSANMIGLYYLPLPTLCHEIGCPSKGASKALRRLSEAHFAYYDEASEQVWIPEMARFQLGDSLLPGDKRIIGLKKELQQHRNSPFFNAFLDRYRTAYHLSEVSPSEAPPKPLRSQEQEQEQEQEKENTLSAAPTVRASDNGFRALWALHPKGSKSEALAAYRQAKPPVEAVEAMRAQVAHKADCDRRGAFCANLQDLHRWLKKRRWEDEIPVAEAPASPYADLPEARICHACKTAGEPDPVHEWRHGKRTEPCPQETAT